MARIFVYAELREGQPAAIAYELLAKARELGDAEAVALGPGAVAAASELGRHGAKVVHVDIDPAELGKIRRPDVPIVGDCRQVITEIVRALEGLDSRVPQIASQPVFTRDGTE